MPRLNISRFCLSTIQFAEQVYSDHRTTRNIYLKCLSESLVLKELVYCFLFSLYMSQSHLCHMIFLAFHFQFLVGLSYLYSSRSGTYTFQLSSIRILG